MLCLWLWLYQRRQIIVLIIIILGFCHNLVFADARDKCTTNEKQPSTLNQQGSKSSLLTTRVLFPQFLKDAIADASNPIHRVWETKGLATVTTTTTTTTGGGGDSSCSNAAQQRQQQQQRKESILPAGSQMETVDEVEGAQLLSASLHIVSTTFGLLADSVRISGETLAGVIGSSVKLTGTAIKTVSTGFGAASRALDPEQKQQQQQQQQQPQQPDSSSVDYYYHWGSSLSSESSSSMTSKRTRRELTLERIHDARRRQRHGSRHCEYDDFRVVINARKVAAKSIRLVGSVVDGVGESLLLAGAATEYLGSTSVGVAESAVRIVEDFVGALSITMLPKQQQQQHARRHRHHHQGTTSSSRHWHDSISFASREKHRRNHTYVSFGSRSSSSGDGDDGDSSKLKASSNRKQSTEQQPLLSFWLDLVDNLRSQMADFFDFLYTDTEGVPSLAPEFLLLFAFCYLATILTMMWSSRAAARHLNMTPTCSSLLRHPTTKQQSVVGLGKLLPPAAAMLVSAAASKQELNDLKDHLLVHQKQVKKVSSAATRALQFVRPLTYSILLLSWAVTFRIFVISRWLLSLLLRVAFHRWTAIFGIYSFAWLYIGRACQLRAQSIQRNAESVGFRSAIDSIGVSTEPAPESALWLNAIISQIWRVPIESEVVGSNSQRHHHLPSIRNYPQFVTRAMGPLDCAGKYRHDAAESFSPPYGGLEPYIASHLGSSVMRTLDSALASHPTDVAYISLYSFTLGRNPPIAKSVKLLGCGVTKSSKVQQQQQQQQPGLLLLAVDADVQLDDFSLVLEVKLSSLQYSMLPSTKVAIHSVSARMRLNLQLTLIPDFPFISTMEVSLDELPEFNIRITPLDDGSGLRGVDLGSLPLIRAWVQDAVRETMSEYVTPKYVSVDLAALVTPQATSSSNRETTAPDSVMDIGRLRNKKTTGHEINPPNPRTSTPLLLGITVASVGSKLSSRNSAMMRVTGRSGENKRSDKLRPALLVRPTTELSRLAMERWLEANNNKNNNNKDVVQQEEVAKQLNPKPSKNIASVVGLQWNKLHRAWTKFFRPPG